ncbi:hypothetical protein CAPTEDRAFT_205216 [Capitella teleta]|uniref:Uncharacterized protein n=1 Tax=Capitella teleta TaxID=283909 RepID=R7UKN1_CAPTE|nr:hypothetical protein CAPTEDRAFT_205216 [Capitella teleta]|eukprot:ELU06790.1 hypothetical protein CAPTEDRAFT_205216 [Capitella teleta]
MASKRKQSLESWIVKKQRLDPSRSPPGPPPTAAPTTGTQKRDAHRISGFNQEWSKEYSWLKEVDGEFGVLGLPRLTKRAHGDWLLTSNQILYSIILININYKDCS